MSELSDFSINRVEEQEKERRVELLSSIFQRYAVDATSLLYTTLCGRPRCASLRHIKDDSLVCLPNKSHLRPVCCLCLKCRVIASDNALVLTVYSCAFR